MSRPTNEVRQLRVKLTGGEIAKYSKELAKQNQDLKEVEEAKKEVVGKYDSQIKTIKLALLNLSRKVTTEEEDRNVDCWWDYDFAKGEKSLIRSDTGEVVETQIIRDEERQKSFLTETKSFTIP